MFGQEVSDATISSVSLGEGQFMVTIEETLPDGNVKRGYKVQDAEGNLLKEIYNITNENNIVIQSSIVTYDREKILEVKNILYITLMEMLLVVQRGTINCHVLLVIFILILMVTSIR